MYGMGGGFGNMPYQSPGSSILSGIQAGAGFIEHAQAMQDAREQHNYERAREDRLDQMHQAQIDFTQRHVQNEEDRQHWNDVLNWAQEQQKELEKVSAAAEAHYPGGFAAYSQTDDYKTNFEPIKNQINAARGAYAKGVMAPLVVAGNNANKDFVTQLGTGNVDVHDPSQDGNMHKLFTGCAVDPQRALVADGQTKSPLQQNLDAMHDAFGDYASTQDPSKLTAATQTLYGDLINTHLNSVDAAGHAVTARSLNGLVPSLDGTGFHPVIQTDAQGYNGSTSTTPAAPPATDPHDPDSGLSIWTPQSIMDRTGRLNAISTMLANSPQLQESLKRSCANPPQDSLDYAHAATGAGFNPQQLCGPPIKQDDGTLRIPATDLNGRQTGQTTTVPSNVTPFSQIAPWLPAAQKTTAEQDAIEARKRLVGTKRADGSVITQQDIDAKTAGIDLGGPEASKPIASIAEANQVVADKTVNPTTGKPFKSAGEYLAWAKGGERAAEFARKEADKAEGGLKLDTANAPVRAKADADVAMNGAGFWERTDPKTGLKGFFKKSPDGKQWIPLDADEESKATGIRDKAYIDRLNQLHTPGGGIGPAAAPAPVPGGGGIFNGGGGGSAPGSFAAGVQGSVTDAPAGGTGATRVNSTTAAPDPGATAAATSPKVVKFTDLK